MRSVWVRALVGSVVVLAGLGATPVVYAATGGWEGASFVASGQGSELVAALAANGTAIAAWDRTPERYVAVRTPGSQSFGEPVDLGDSQEGGGPALAADANGDAVMAWLTEAPIAATTHEEIFEVDVDYRPAGGQFSQSTVTTVPGSTYATVAPVVAFLPDGTAVVAWGGDVNGHPAFADSVRPPGVNSQFGAANSYVLPPDRDPGMAPRALQIAPGAADSASLLWKDTETEWLTSDEFIEDDELMVGRVDALGGITARAVPGASSQEDVVYGRPGSASGTTLSAYALAADEAGDVAVVWGLQPARGTSSFGPLYGSYAPSDQPFQSTPDVIDASVDVTVPIDGSMLASGTAVFAATWQSQGAQYVQRTRSAASFPATITSLPGVPDASGPQLTAAGGQTIVEYTRDDGLGQYSAIAPDGEAFGSPTLLDDTGQGASALAGDGDGNAVTVFNEYATSSSARELMSDTFAAEPPAVSSGQAGGPAGTGPPSPPMLSGATAASPPAPPSMATNVGAGSPGSANVDTLALHIAAAIVRFARNRTRATIPARCVTASAHPCRFTGRVLAAHWQARTRRWVPTRSRLGTSAGTLHASRPGQLSVQLGPAGVTALRHRRFVNAWLTGTLLSSGQRISVATPIRLER